MRNGQLPYRVVSVEWGFCVYTVSETRVDVTLLESAEKVLKNKKGLEHFLYQLVRRAAPRSLVSLNLILEYVDLVDFVVAKVHLARPHHRQATPSRPALEAGK